MLFTRSFLLSGMLLFAVASSASGQSIAFHVTAGALEGSSYTVTVLTPGGATPGIDVEIGGQPVAEGSVMVSRNDDGTFAVVIDIPPGTAGETLELGASAGNMMGTHTTTIGP